MEARSEYRDRDATDVAVLDALVDRNDEGMTVFELRARVDAGIDDLEAALGRLKEDGLITAETTGDRTVIRVDERVRPDPDHSPEPTVFDHMVARARRVVRRLEGLLGRR